MQASYDDGSVRTRGQTPGDRSLQRRRRRQRGGRDDGGVSRAPADGDVGPAGDDDPGALTSYVGVAAGVETFTFATSRTFCVLDKVLVALGRTKVVYSLYTLAPRHCHDRHDLYMRLYVIYIPLLSNLSSDLKSPRAPPNPQTGYPLVHPKRMEAL